MGILSPGGPEKEPPNTCRPTEGLLTTLQSVPVVSVEASPAVASLRSGLTY